MSEFDLIDEAIAAINNKSKQDLIEEDKKRIREHIISLVCSSIRKNNKFNKYGLPECYDKYLYDCNTKTNTQFFLDIKKEIRKRNIIILFEEFAGYHGPILLITNESFEESK